MKIVAVDYKGADSIILDLLPNWFERIFLRKKAGKAEYRGSGTFWRHYPSGRHDYLVDIVITREIAKDNWRKQVDKG